MKLFLPLLPLLVLSLTSDDEFFENFVNLEPAESLKTSRSANLNNEDPDFVYYLDNRISQHLNKLILKLDQLQASQTAKFERLENKIGRLERVQATNKRLIKETITHQEINNANSIKLKGIFPSHLYSL